MYTLDFGGRDTCHGVLNDGGLSLTVPEAKYRVSPPPCTPHVWYKALGSGKQGRGASNTYTQLVHPHGFMACEADSEPTMAVCYYVVLTV